MAYEEGGAQGIGGFALDDWDESKRQRVGSEFGCELIRRLLLLMNVNDFSEMAGKYIWVYGEGVGLSFCPEGISALKVDNRGAEPFMFLEVLKDSVGAI